MKKGCCEYPPRLPTIVRRAPHEPVPDLTDYTIVHRAMSVAIRRLADATEEISPHPARLVAPR